MEHAAPARLGERCNYLKAAIVTVPVCKAPVGLTHAMPGEIAKPREAPVIVIVAGVGRHGQIIARLRMAQGVPAAVPAAVSCAVRRDPGQVASHHRD